MTGTGWLIWIFLFLVLILAVKGKLPDIWNELKSAFNGS